jgi:AraC-like DNA-binding protein
MSLTEFSDWIVQNLKVLFSFLGAIQGFILAVVVLFYPQEHSTSNRILSAFIFVQAYLLIASRIVEWMPADTSWIIYSLRLLVYISLFLYVKSLYSHINWRKQWVHLPIWLIDILRIRAITLYKVPRALETDGYVYQFFGSTLEILSIFWLFATMALYFFLTYRELIKYRKKAEENFSDLNAVGVKWAKQIFFGRYIIGLVDYLLIFVAFTFVEWYKPYNGILNVIIYTGFLYFITIKGKLNPRIYQLRMIQEKPEEQKEEILEESDHKPEKELTEEHQLIAQNVLKLMEEQKLYREEGLSIKQVADELGVQLYMVSQSINLALGKNFFELVNGYRVEEAKSMIMDEKYNHLSMIGIGFESGFSSKTAFNTAFKKHTGITPSEYKRLGVNGSHAR